MIMKDYQAEVCRYQPTTEAEGWGRQQQTEASLVNYSYHVKTKFNNCFIIYLIKWMKNYRL